MSAISIQNITKKYKEITALDAISFEVKEGELFGLIGTDGAGKSTLFRILTTVLLPDSGEAYISGRHVVKEFKEIRKRVGYMPGKFSLYQDLSVEENLSFFATIFGTSIAENYKLIKDIYVQLEPFKKRLAGNLSGGMKQKLALCCALIHKPKILFLDEPTTGVDVVSRKEFWDMLKELKTKGISILVSTPYMDEASLCDRIALIKQGTILSVDEPSKLIEHFKYPLYAVRADDFYRLLLTLRKKGLTKSVLTFGDYLHLITKQEMSVSQIKSELEEQEFSGLEIKKIQPEIEDIFLELGIEKKA